MLNIKTGRLIEQARKDKGLSQSELADAVGVSKKTVKNWELGLRFPDVSLMDELTRELDLSPTELIKGERVFGVLDESESSELICRALKAQKRELRHRWVLITLILVAVTAMLCLGASFVIYIDRVLLLNIRIFNAFVPTLLAVIIGAAVRCISRDKENFYITVLIAMAVWIVCELVAAIGCAQGLLAAGVFTAAVEAAWLLLCGIAGAWLVHGVMTIVQRVKNHKT